jgi:hypothetical protein
MSRLAGRKSPRLNTEDTIQLASILSERRSELADKSPYRIAKAIRLETGLNVTPSNVMRVAKAARITIGAARPKRKMRTSNVQAVATILERICIEVGIDTNHPIMLEIQSLKQ